MTPRVPNGTGLFRAPAALFLMIALVSIPTAGSAAGSFPGYPEKIREQAVRVVGAASSAPTEAFGREVRSLRKLMFDHGILSINAIPDLVFERAVKEGWTRQA